MERVKGIEPSLSAWEADVLPLNYTRSGITLPERLPAGLRQECAPTPGAPQAPPVGRGGSHHGDLDVELEETPAHVR